MKGQDSLQLIITAAVGIFITIMLWTIFSGVIYEINPQLTLTYTLAIIAIIIAIIVSLYIKLVG